MPNNEEQRLTRTGDVMQEHAGVDFPVNRISLDQAEREAINQIFHLTNDALLSALETEVQKAKSIADPQLKRYYMPAFEALIQLHQSKSLESAERSVRFVQQIANAYRSRMHV